VSELPEWLTSILAFLVSWLPLAAWVVWWLLAVNWKKAWVALAQGAWLAVLFLMFLSSFAWSCIDQSALTITGVGTVSSFWWRLGCVCALTLTALFCGWLQGNMGWAPPEIELEPPELPNGHHGNGANHAHGQEHG
jgi:hypothetical protein